VSTPPTPHGLHFVADSPIPGLTVAERRVEHPEATIICIHGGLDRGGSFARLARRTDRFDLVTFDRRGYQGFARTGPLGLESHVSDLTALAHHEGRAERSSSSATVTAGRGDRRAIADESLARLVITYEAPLPWILRRDEIGVPLGDDPQLEAEKFFRRIVSDSAWERLSELERDSRRKDGPALFDDLSSLRAKDATVRPRVTESADGVRVRRQSCAGLLRLPQRRTGVAQSTHPKSTVTNAAHGAHLSIPDQLAALIGELWDETCASA